MSIIGSGHALLLASAAAAPVVTGISRSLRFNGNADSSYLSRTPSTAGNRKTWTWAAWVKRSKLTINQWIFSAASGPTADRNNFLFNTDDKLVVGFNISGTWTNSFTDAVFRDASAWYHIVLALDTTQSTDSNRIKIYVNGVQQTLTGAYPAQNADTPINDTVAHSLGRYEASSSEYFNGYLADVHFVDGLALGPGYFGEYDSNGVWQPKQFDNGGSTVNDGTQWSSLTSGGTVNGSYPMSQTFDGSTSTTGVRAVSGGGFIFGGSLGISYSSSIRIHSGISGVGTQKFKLNDGSEIDFPENTWVTVASGSGTLNKLEITAGTTGNANIYLGAVEVDGVIMLDSTTQTLSYGTNGFNLSFGDNSGTSSTTLGKDAAGSNNWTPNNFSVASGSGNDSLVDVPRNGDETDTGVGNEVRGNYCTWNPLTNGSYTTLSNGNLEATGNTNANNGNSRSTMAVTTGKWYTEMTVSATTANIYPSIGILLATDATTPANAGSSGNQVGYPADSVAYEVSGVKRIANSTSSYGSSYTNGDVIGIAVDADNGAIYFSKNGTWQGSGDPTSGASKTGAAYTWTGGSREYVFGTAHYNGAKSYQNWGQSAFAYTAPSGFKALCTANLPTPTIEDGSAYMDVVTYTGNGSTQTISGLGFSPDLAWIKGRSIAADHGLFDIVRGTTKRLVSNATQSEDTQSGVTAFNSDGFSLGSYAGQNNSGSTYVAWTWDGGSSTVSNTDGSITSSVRANTSAGFSVATFTKSSGTSTTDTVGHGLNTAPYLIITKQRDGTEPWYTYHQSLGNAARVQLNDDSAQTTGTTVWGSTSPTSSVFSIRNVFNGDYVAYCFAPVAGYSSAFSYTGNGSNDGPMVYLGFRPKYLLFKCSSASAQWRVFDTARSPYNLSDIILEPDNSSAESSTSAAIDILSNGFKIRGTAGSTVINGSGQTYIGMAFAESPFKYARAR